MFKLRCENCGHEDDLDEFLIDCYSYKDKYDERFEYETITVKCPACDFHTHIENIKQ